MNPNIGRLHGRITALAQQQPFAVHWQITPLVSDSGTGADPAVVGYGAQTQLASFSTRKVSLLLACLALVHRGDLNLAQRLPVTEEMKDGVQAGIIKNMAAGTELSLEDHLRQMMITSDNICTQLVFEAIGQVTGDALQWVNDYCAWAGMRATVHREIFPRSGELAWHHSIEHMTVTTPADQAHLLAELGRGTQCADAAGRLQLTPQFCRFAVELMRQIHTPLLGAETSSLVFAEKNGRGLRGLSQVGLATQGDIPVAAVAVFAENIPTQLPDGAPGRLAIYRLFAAIGQAVEDWHLSREPAPRGDGEPQLSAGFLAKTFRDGDLNGDLDSDLKSDTVQQQANEAEVPHPLAGAGKLIAALTLAQRASREPDLLELPVRIRQKHRDAAAAGPLRTHTGDLTLTLGDAVGLIIATSDAATSLAVCDTLNEQGVDLAAEAHGMLDRLAAGGAPLSRTVISGTEPTAEATGDLLTGETTPADMVQLLRQLAESGGLTEPSTNGGGGAIPTESAAQVLKWMEQVFEPAGLTYALPGYGPIKVPQWSVSTGPLRSPSHPLPPPQGWTSVMITGTAQAPLAGSGILCAAAHMRPGSGSRTAAATAVATGFGELGLAAYRPGR